jgi:TRAP-type C4-dicarboxylate transport system permease small subunit
MSMMKPPAGEPAAIGWFTRLDRAAARVDRIFVIAAELSLLALLLLLAVSIAGRTLFNASIPDRSLIAQNYLMVALVFFALGHVQKIGAHIEVTVLAGLVPARVNKAFRLFGLILGLVIFGGATWFSGVKAWQAYSVDALMFSSVLDLRDWPGLAVVTVGLAWWTLRMLLQLVEQLILPGDRMALLDPIEDRTGTHDEAD